MLDFSIENIDQLKRAKTLTELDQCYKKLMEQLGYTKFTYTYYHQDKSLIHEVYPSSMKEWHNHFQRSNYEAIDPIGSQVKQSFLPVFWDLQVAYKNARAQARKMFSEAIDYGLSQGTSIPIHGPMGFEAIQVIQHPELSAHIAAKPSLKLLLQQFAIHYHQNVYNLRQEKSSSPLLTPRELECLRLTEQRFTAKKIATALCITPRTVVFHMENINKKLKTPNKFHAVNVAKKLGLLI